MEDGTWGLMGLQLEYKCDEQTDYLIRKRQFLRLLVPLSPTVGQPTLSL